MAKYAVIGSNCFTGSHFVSALLDSAENEVIAISRSNEPAPLFRAYLNCDLTQYRFYQIDIVKEFQRLRDLLQRERPEYVINVAALSEVGQSNFSPIEYYDINTSAVVRLVNYLREANWLRCYVHISSAEIYGSCDTAINEDQRFNPSTPYAASKAAGDMHIASVMRQFGFPALTIRSTNVYGARQQLFKIIPRTAIYGKSGRRLMLHGGGVAMKSFIHISDVVSGMMAAIKRDKKGVFHFSSPSETTVAEIVELVCDKLSLRYEDVTEVVEERLGQDQRYWLDCSKARTELNWRPEISLDAGIRETVSWVESNWHLIKSFPLEYQHKV